MAKWKKARGVPTEGEELNSKLKRHYKEKARREKLLRLKPPGVKEKFVSGCFGLGIVLGIVLAVALVWSLIQHFAE